MLALVVFCFLMFLLYGVYYNGFGANATATMAFFRITESQQGLILTVQAVGCMIVAIMLGIFGERLNKIHGLMFGLVVLGIAGLLIGTMTLYTEPGTGYGLLLAYSLLAGVGYITIDLLMNGVIADVYPTKKNTLLPLVHGFYGTGAMLAPIFITGLVDPGNPSDFAIPYLILGALFIAILVGLTVIRKKVVPMTSYADMTAIRARAASNPTEIFHDRRTWLLLIACFFYLCFQIGLSSWLPKYCMNRLRWSYNSSGFVLTLYFLGSLIMRFLSPVAFKRIPVRTFYILSILMSAIVFVMFLLLPVPFAVKIVLMFLTGLLQGSAVPALVIICCDAFPTRTASASSLFVLGVSLASFASPAVMGHFIETTGYQAPMFMIAGCLLASTLALTPIKKFTLANVRDKKTQ